MSTDLVKTATDLVKTNASISIAEILQALSPEPATAEPTSVVPLPREISSEAREAVARMMAVYGSVTPTERRALTPAETSDILDERLTLDLVKKSAEARLSDITTIIHNHLDVEVEAQGGTDKPRDAKGHYLVAGKVIPEGGTKVFSREIRSSSPSLDLSAIQAMDEAGEIDHATFLSMTTQVRVIDETKVLAAIRKDPSLLNKIALATRPGSQTSSVYVRARK